MRLGETRDFHIPEPPICRKAENPPSLKIMVFLLPAGLTFAKTMERAAKALKGFQREYDREHEWIYRRRRQQSRDQNRGR